MIEAPDSIRSSRDDGWFSRLRRAINFLKTFDPDAIDHIIEGFKESQRNLEKTDKQMVRAQRALESQITALEKIHRSSVLNIKNLGYELGRVLAEKDLRKPVMQPGPINLKSKLCTQDDFTQNWLLYWCQELRIAPYYHRKIWELCYICQVLFASGKLRPGQWGLGFGCGQEPLPSLFVKYGANVIATDLDHNRPEATVWRSTAQHSADAESYRRRDICPDEERLAAIHFRPIDMNAIPIDFDGRFDFCWSACAFEHLGSLAKGLEFVENSLRTLNKGGIAVHTTEFTLDEGDTIDNHPTVLYQRHHLLEFSEKIRARGYEVAQYDFSPGGGILDRFIDLPPWSHELYISPQHHAHLKLSVDGFTCTSIGMIIRV